MRDPETIPPALIGSFTGRAGEQTDNHLRQYRLPNRARSIKTGNQPECFVVSEGDQMQLPISTKTDAALRLAPPLEVRLSGSKAAGLIEGYASAFGGPADCYGDVIDPGAFRRSIAKHLADGTMPAMLWTHDMAQPIGRWTEMKEDGYGLLVRGKLNTQTERGRDALEHLKQRDVTGLSIGFMIAKGGAKSSPDGYRVLTDIDLWEVSVVAVPANQRARISGVKSLQTKSELIDLLRDGGLSKAAAVRVAAGGWSALGEDETDDLDDLAQALRTQIEELKSWK